MHPTLCHSILMEQTYPQNECTIYAIRIHHIPICYIRTYQQCTLRIMTYRLGSVSTDWKAIHDIHLSIVCTIHTRTYKSHMGSTNTSSHIHSHCASIKSICTTNQSTPSSTMTYISLSYHYHHHELSTHQKSDLYHQCTSHQPSEDITPSCPQIDTNINNYYHQHQYTSYTHAVYNTRHISW